ncbi:MAG: hypothetical protein C0601_07600 [Candidatus Muiribacterium halophilum]|uniref:Uncharacterized protein n=1 Tax=Muiribacterium halophilum TaxID=2053465 RepID=A0A2N5ZFK5_MUIH1|nr:MAG: hypothetical protein C0601_07600 [Candidatus Muirbacterium halophilum]
MRKVSGYNIDELANNIVYNLKLHSDNPDARFKLKQVMWYAKEERKYPDILIHMALGILFEQGIITFEKLGRTGDFNESIRVRLK